MLSVSCDENGIFGGVAVGLQRGFLGVIHGGDVDPLDAGKGICIETGGDKELDAIRADSKQLAAQRPGGFLQELARRAEEGGHASRFVAAGCEEEDRPAGQAYAA
jgi:hypothetical protein